MNQGTEISLNVARELAFDAVVIGGGVSGSMAGIAVARSGASTLVVEEQGFLGGSLTSMGVGPMMSFHNGAGRQVVRGLPQELIDRLQKVGASPGHIADTTTYCSTVTPFDSEALKIELETMLSEAGAAILYHTQLAAALRAQDGQVESVIICNKGGLTRVKAKVFIESTGDGDLVSRLNAPFQLGRGEDSAGQPMTMNLKLANVDVAAIRGYARKYPEDFLWEYGQDEALRRLETSPRLSLAGFLSAWADAQAAGEVEVPRDQVLFFETATPGVVIVNTSRIQGLDATDPFELSQAEMIGRRQCRQIFDFLRKRCVGFEQSVRMDTAAKVGVRESRHVQGAYLLTARDLLEEKQFPDGIAVGGYPIDIHSPDGITTETQALPTTLSYQIPLRCLLVPTVENLIVVGRCVSATHEASAAIRVTPIAMAIGHAGGVLAGEAIRLNCAPLEVPAENVRTKLIAQGALLS